MMKTCTKHAERIYTAARIPEIVSRAFHVATQGRPGPVVIALPEDMLTDEVEVADALPYAPVVMKPGAADMEALQRRLHLGEGPIVEGHGGVGIDILQADGGPQRQQGVTVGHRQAQGIAGEVEAGEIGVVVVRQIRIGGDPGINHPIAHIIMQVCARAYGDFVVIYRLAESFQKCAV